jgi:phosphosulfolactate phosphohydrolase-like enzyme
LQARGFGEDVTLALEVDVSDRVPTRTDGRLFTSD